MALTEQKFLQAGSGAVNRDVTDKLKEFVSVKDFGAVGDGVTDDTAAIQAAITYCQNNLKALVFPENNVSSYYKITASLVVTKPIVIIGDGSRNVTIGGALSAGAYALDIDGTSFGTYENAEIRGITLMPGAGAHCMRIKDVSNSIFSDIGLRTCERGIDYTGTRCFSNSFEKIYTITGMTGAAFFMTAHTGGGQHSFRECSLGGTTGFSLASTTSTDSIAFYNTNFEQCTTNSVNIAGTVDGLSFFGCRTEGCDGIDFVIAPAAAKRVTGLVINGCFFSSSDAGGSSRISLGGATGIVRGFDVCGNTVQHSTGNFSSYLVRLNGDGESGTIANNFLDGLIANCSPVDVLRPGVLVFNNEGNNGKFTGTVPLERTGSWTPVDASGAGLTLTAAIGRYQRVGNTVHWWANIVYPVTANGSGSLIGGLPFNIDNSTDVAGRAGAVVTNTTSTTVRWVMQGPGTAKTFRFEKSGVTQATNAECSSAEFYVSGSYTTLDA